MQRAAETTRSGCVLTSASGAVEGYIDGLLFDSSHETSAEDMLTHVIDALLNDGGELVTVLVGAEGQMTHIHLMADHVGVDFDFISGGQTSSVYLVGVE
jgi:dihydroxyacetone kinase-like predicted kinase